MKKLHLFKDVNWIMRKNIGGGDDGLRVSGRWRGRN